MTRKTGLTRRRPTQVRERTQDEVWKRAYQKALKQYGHKAQAERIAWAAIDQAPRRVPRKRVAS